jgi:Domain of unknown function (4846)
MRSLNTDQLAAVLAGAKRGQGLTNPCIWNDPVRRFLLPMKPFTPLTLLSLFCACLQPACTAQQAHPTNPYPSIGAIPLPPGYHRLPADKAPFTDWLRKAPLKTDRTVYLYNGSPKRNQDAQFAVLDVSVGHQDLQQCADAVMRLRAEFLYRTRDFINIDYYTEAGVRLNFLEWANGKRVRLNGSRLERYSLTGDHHYCDTRACFDNYLNTVFTYCGTRSLEKQLVPIPLARLAPGDVFIKGGSPGHAMLVVDAAEDNQGHRIFLLAQSYMPAQDIHIVNNPMDQSLSPWYRADATRPLVETPEYTFTINQLRTWPIGD